MKILTILFVVLLLLCTAMADSKQSFRDLILKRSSIRSFEAEGISSETLKFLLESINLAPSAGNLQAYEVVIVKSEKMKRNLSEAAHSQRPILDAPVVFCFVTNPQRNTHRYRSRGNDLYTVQDATIAASYLQLAAASMGLGTVWIGAFNEDAVNSILELPGDMTTVAIIPVGHYHVGLKVREKNRRQSVLYKEI